MAGRVSPSCDVRAWVLPCLPAVGPTQGHPGCPAPSHHAAGSSRLHRSQSWVPMCAFMFRKLWYPRSSGWIPESQYVPALTEDSQTAAHPSGSNGLGSQGSQPMASSPWSRGRVPRDAIEGKEFFLQPCLEECWSPSFSLGTRWISSRCWKFYSTRVAKLWGRRRLAACSGAGAVPRLERVPSRCRL